MDVNLGAALWLSQAVEPYMRQRGKGSIVHVSARPGTDPTAGMAAYSLSKAALSHLVRILDLELRPHGIRVNAVAPQLLDTAAQPGHFPGRSADARRPAGGGRERHRVPRRRPRRARQRRDRPGLRGLAEPPAVRHLRYFSCP
jgi:NAD(P)-dependent dehydrogenase (short-subunit alcohol dehydrogenase family)